MTTRQVSIAVLTLVFALCLPVASYSRGWAYLGEAHVDGAADHDKIKVGKSDGRFNALQLKVDFAPIEFRHIVVHFHNGADEQVEVRQRIRAGGATRDIDLRGHDRIIDSVEIWYERANYGSKRPRVRLFGR